MSHNNLKSRLKDDSTSNIAKKRFKKAEPNIGVETLTEEEKERILKLIENEPEVKKKNLPEI
jgi:hypothetical protein